MKKLMLFSMWLVASAAAVGVAWAGVSVVDNQVVDPPSAAELASPDPSGGPNPNSAASEGNDASPSTQATPSAPTPNPTRTTQPAPRSTTDPTTQPAPTSQPAPTTQQVPTTPPPTPAPTTPPPPAATTQTFTLTGGTAAISFSASGVEVLWATPNPGFRVVIELESPGIKVEFRADHHRSRVDAWWSGGPQHSIREEPRD